MTVLSDAWQFPGNLKSLFVAGTVALAAIASGACVPDTQERNRAVRPDFAIHVMTQNVYDGIDYPKFINWGTDPAGLLSTTLTGITDTDPLARAALHASQIAQEHPDLLAIQEAVVVQVDGYKRVDMLSDLVKDLADLHKPYTIIVEMNGFDTGSGNSIRIYIRDAILVRSDLPSDDGVVKHFEQGLYKLSNNAGPFNQTFQPSDPNDLMRNFANMNFRRNWMFVDMQLHGHVFRFVTTHLDVADLSPDTQQQQSKELLEVVGNTGLPVIVTGDFNAVYHTYHGLAAADYSDAWIQDDGATCCQDQDKMNNPTSTRDKKIDLILLRGGVSATSVRLVGDMAAPCSQQPCALWASDHAGVVADLVFTSIFKLHPVWLMIAIGGMLLAGLRLGVRRWLRRGRQ
jgi:endonuclease/exonuclease/phosphatase family metal-dependent hydrolase